MGTQRRAVRRWAWAVLVLSGGTAAGLNTWHALEAGELPPLWAVVVGIGPVLLAVVLSHLVALVLDDAPEQSEQPPAGGEQRRGRRRYRPSGRQPTGAGHLRSVGTCSRAGARERVVPGRSGVDSGPERPGGPPRPRGGAGTARAIGPRTDQQQVVGCTATGRHWD